MPILILAITLALAQQPPGAGAAEIPWQASVTRTRFTEREGVPSSTVTALCYDAEGFLIVGTSGGLARYDGSHFEIILAAETPGFAGNEIRALLTDENGRTWVGSRYGGLSAFRDGTFELIADGAAIGQVQQILESADGTLWVLGRKLSRFDEGQLTLLGADEGLPDTSFARMLEDPSGQVWVGGPDGVFRQSQDGFVKIHSEPSRWLLLDFAGNVWSHTDAGLLVSLGKAPEATIELGDVQILAELLRPQTGDRPPRLLLSTTKSLFLVTPQRGDGSGIELNEVKVRGKRPGELPRINCFLAAGDASNWAGTEFDGLDYVDRHSVVFDSSYEPSERVVSAHVVQLPDGKALARVDGVDGVSLINPNGGRAPLPPPPRWLRNPHFDGRRWGTHVGLDPYGTRGTRRTPVGTRRPLARPGRLDDIPRGRHGLDDPRRGTTLRRGPPPRVPSAPSN